MLPTGIQYLLVLNAQQNRTKWQQTCS